MQISKKRSRINFRSFLWHAVFLALASNFMDVDTIIPSMLLKAGGNSVHLGFLTAIMIGGSSVMQLVFAPMLSKKPIKLKYLLLGVNLRVVALLLIAIMFYYSSLLKGDIIITLIFVLISLFSFSGSYAGISYTDILGKSIRSEMRKSFFSVKEVVLSIGIFISAVAVKYLLTKFNYPDNYALLFMVAGILLFIASLGFWNIREVRSVNPVKKSLFDFFRLIPSEIAKNSNLKYYLLIINTLGFGISVLPFLILFAKDNFDLSYNLIGNILIFRISGMLFASLTYYKFSKFVDYKKLLKVAVVIGTLIPLVSLLLTDSQFYFQFIFFFSGIFVSIFKMSNNGILLEISTNENRALYAGISGAGKIFAMLFPLVAGVLIFYVGFAAVFGFVSLMVMMSYFFVRKLNCR